jgi:hypothetical protein
MRKMGRRVKMITTIKEPYLISRRDVDKKFDGRWVLLHYKDLDPADGYGYLVAYSSGDVQEEDTDWNKLRLIAAHNKYSNESEVAYGYKNRGAEMLHVL